MLCIRRVCHTRQLVRNGIRVIRQKMIKMVGGPPYAAPPTLLTASERLNADKTALMLPNTHWWHKIYLLIFCMP